MGAEFSYTHNLGLLCVYKYLMKDRILQTKHELLEKASHNQEILGASRMRGIPGQSWHARESLELPDLIRNIIVISLVLLRYYFVSYLICLHTLYA
jgi:hypothetical protein